MAISLTSLGTNSNTSGGTLTKPSLTVPAGSQIVACVSERSTSVVAGSVSDTLNTYSSAIGADLNNVTTNGFIEIFYAWNCVALSSATLTYTKAVTASATAFSLFYATGIQTTSDPLRLASSATGSSKFPSVSENVTTGDLVLGVIGANIPGAITQDSTNGAYGTPPVSNNAGSGFVTIFGGNLIAGSTGTLAYAPQLTNSVVWGALIAAFIPASGGGTNITVPVGSASFSGAAPVLTQSITIAPGFGAIALTGYAPTTTSSTNIIIPAGAIAFSESAPALGFGISLASGSLSLTGDAPSLGAPVAISIPVGSLALSKFAAAIGAGQTFGTAALTLMGYSPAGVVNQAIAVPAGALTITPRSPTIATPTTISIGLGSLVFSEYAPGISQTASGSIPTGTASLSGYAGSLDNGLTPANDSLALSGAAPVVSRGTVVAFPSGALLINGSAVSLNEGISVPCGSVSLVGANPKCGNGIIVPAGALAISSARIVIDAGISVPVGSAQISGLVPVLGQPEIPSGQIATTGYAPSVIISGGIAIVVGTGNLNLLAFAPAVEDSGNLVGIKCHILSGQFRPRVLSGASRARVLSGGCC